MFMFVHEKNIYFQHLFRLSISVFEPKIRTRHVIKHDMLPEPVPDHEVKTSADGAQTARYRQASLEHALKVYIALLIYVYMRICVYIYIYT